MISISKSIGLSYEMIEDKLKEIESRGISEKIAKNSQIFEGYDVDISNLFPIERPVVKAHKSINTRVSVMKSLPIFEINHADAVIFGELNRCRFGPKKIQN